MASLLWQGLEHMLTKTLLYVQRSYTSDWVAFSLLLVGYIYIAAFVEPFHRLFTINDIRISFPHAEVERVPLGMFLPCFVPFRLLLPSSLTHPSQLPHAPPFPVQPSILSLRPTTSPPLRLRPLPPSGPPHPNQLPPLLPAAHAPPHHFRFPNLHNPHHLPHGPHQKHGRPPSSRPDRSMPTRSFHPSKQTSQC